MSRKTKNQRVRSRQLLQIAWNLTKLDRRMLLFPTISAFAGILTGFLAVVVFSGAETETAPDLLVPVPIASGPLTFITIACGVGTASLVADVLDGRSPAVDRAWALIRERATVIFAWTLVMWTVGALLRLLQERLPLGGRIAALVLDISFSLATMFAIPVLAFEGLGPTELFKRSASLTRERFGNLVVGSVAIGAGSVVAVLPGIGLLVTGVFASPAGAVVLIGLGIGWILGTAAVFTSLDYIYRTVVYRNAIGLPIGGAGLTATDLNLGINRGA